MDDEAHPFTACSFETDKEKVGCGVFDLPGLKVTQLMPDFCFAYILLYALKLKMSTIRLKIVS